MIVVVVVVVATCMRGYRGLHEVAAKLYNSIQVLIGTLPLTCTVLPLPI